ncbi:MAG: hypothetical protein ACHQ6T_11320 [Myxococcota bacterium]
MTRAARVLAAALLLGACATAARPPEVAKGPSPEERGFRALTPTGVALVYDSARRLYAVPSQPGAYWLDGHYFRRAAGGWQTSANPSGPWQPCPPAELPEGLRGAP